MRGKSLMFQGTASSVGKSTLCAAVLAVVGVLAGMLAAIVAGTPVGATVVMVNLAVFAVCYAIGKIQ